MISYESNNTISSFFNPPLSKSGCARLVGINVNGLMYNGGYTRNNMFDLRMNYHELLPELLMALLKQDNTEVLLVPHTYGTPGTVENDLDSCHAFLVV